MPKKKIAVDQIEETPVEALAPTTPETPRLAWGWRVLGGAVVVAAILVVSFQVVYGGKIYPGVSADGVYLGGLSKDDAQTRLSDKLMTFRGATLSIAYGKTTLHVPINSLDVKYDTAKVIDLAYQFGRQGSWPDRLHAQARALLGRPSNFAAYSYDDSVLTPYIGQVTDDVTTPAEDAGLSFNDDKAQVTPAKAGTRLDLGGLMSGINDRLAQTNTDTVTAPTYSLAPVVSTAALTATASQADGFVSGPITLTYAGNTQIITPATIISWLTVGHKSNGDFMVTHNLADLYPVNTTATLDLGRTAVTQYMTNLAGQLYQAPKNAVLAMQNGQLSVTQASRDGSSVDQAAAVNDILAALKQPADNRTVALNIKTVKADVNEDNLSSLGIKEQISEGETYFPGSPSTRLTNVRAGASKFNDVLLKPGEVFSFGALLGDVGPETGYVPELVILGDHEEKQYGGGLCQVSSTAFRAALQAGLPILERVNHAFAISYYTWPYSAPGVDATIYYPSVDFKFKNDTGSYILIQTIMSGYDLKFDFYGTKTKTGVIRGPNFVTGSNDATQPSHTVFYRDVLDLAGNVIKTDKFDTYYKSSKDFPIQKQFN